MTIRKFLGLGLTASVLMCTTSVMADSELPALVDTSLVLNPWVEFLTMTENQVAEVHNTKIGEHDIYVFEDEVNLMNINVIRDTDFTDDTIIGRLPNAKQSELPFDHSFYLTNSGGDDWYTSQYDSRIPDIAHSHSLAAATYMVMDWYFIDKDANFPIDYDYFNRAERHYKGEEDVRSADWIIENKFDESTPEVKIIGYSRDDSKLGTKIYGKDKLDEGHIMLVVLDTTKLPAAEKDGLDVNRPYGSKGEIDHCIVITGYAADKEGKRYFEVYDPMYGEYDEKTGTYVGGRRFYDASLVVDIVKSDEFPEHMLDIERLECKDK